MMQPKMQSFWKGYIKVRLSGPQIERFLNLCAAQGIVIQNLTNPNDSYEMEISVSDYYKLRAPRKKTKTHFKILEKHGMPFFFYKNRKRKAFFIGILILFAILAFSTGFIWDIRFDGNSHYSDGALLELLNDDSITCGMRINKIDCLHIAEYIRTRCPDIVWVSAKIDGTCLVVEIKENTEAEMEAVEKVPDAPCDLVADTDGTIVSIVTRQGTPLVKAGDTCQKGDVLVSGSIDILDNDGNVAATKTVAADADIYINCNYSYYQEIDRTYEEKIYEKSKKLPYFSVWGMELPYPLSDGRSYEIIKNQVPVYLTDSFCLPIAYGWVEVKPYEIQVLKYSEQKIKELSAQNLQYFMKELVNEGCYIVGKNIKVSVSENRCLAKGTIEVIRKSKGKMEIG